MQSQAMAVPQQLQAPMQSQAMAVPQQLRVPMQSQVTAVPTQLQAPSRPQGMAVPQPHHIEFSHMQLQFPVAANSSHGLAGYTIPGTLPALVQPLINMPPPAVPHQLQSVPASYGYITPVQGYQQTATKTLPGHLPTLAQVRQAPDPQQYPLINSTAAAVAGIEPRAPVDDIHRTSIRGESMDILWPDEFVHRSGVSDICFAKLTLPEVVCGTHRDDRY